MLNRSHCSLCWIIGYEILLVARQAYTWATSLLFFIIIICMFPFALGANNSLFNQVAPAVIWVAALLAILLSIGSVFQSDLEEGHLDMLLLSGHPLSLLVLCKIGAHWLTHCLPLVIMSPLLGLLLHLDVSQQITLVITLLLGTPTLSLLGSIGGALVVGTRSSSLLVPVLIMPLYIPTLIFGTGTLLAAAAHQPLNGYFAVMGALLLFSLAIAPLFASMALRMGVSQ